MKKTDKQKKARKSTEIRKQEIVDAAMKILSSEGSRQFTADRLGAEVGLASGSIFRHFSSMEEILDGVVDRIEEIIFPDFPPSADNPLETLHLFFEARVQAIAKHPEISKLLLTSTLIPNSNSTARENRLAEFRFRSRSFVEDCLKQAKTEGLLSSEVSYEDGTVLVLGAIYAIGHKAVGANQNKTDKHLITRIWHLLERALIDKK